MQVQLCGDGARALDRWRASLPDVVLLDLSLPGLDGLQVLAAGPRRRSAHAGAHPHRARHRRRPHPRPEHRRRRLPGQALRPGRAGGPGARAGPARRAARPPTRRPSPSFGGLQRDAEQRRASTLHGQPMELTQREAALLRALLARARPGGRQGAAVRAGVSRRRRRAARGGRGRGLPPAQEARPTAGAAAGHAARAGLPAAAETAMPRRERRWTARVAGRASAARCAPAAAGHPAAGAGLRGRQHRGALPPGAGRRPTRPTTARCWPRPSPSASSSAVGGSGDAARLQRHRALLGARGLRGRQPQPPVLPRQRLRRRDWCPASTTCHRRARKLPPQRLRRAGAFLRRRVPRRRRCAWRCCCSRWPASSGQGMATVQVAETLELRAALARQLLVDTLWRQAALLLAVIAAVVLWSSCSAPRGRCASSAQRSTPGRAGDLTPIERRRRAARAAARWSMPPTRSCSAWSDLLAHQKRFVRDASHQLRTPLAVLKTQVQSARRGDVAPAQALAEIAHTVDARHRAGQPDAGAGQGGAAAPAGRRRGASTGPKLVRAVALDLAPLVADTRPGFSNSRPRRRRCAATNGRCASCCATCCTTPIKHSPPARALALRLVADGAPRRADRGRRGPGIDAGAARAPVPALRRRQRGSGGRRARSRRGLGLAICHEIVDSLGGTLTLDNRLLHGRVTGLDAIVRLPLAPTTA